MFLTKSRLDKKYRSEVKQAFALCSATGGNSYHKLGALISITIASPVLLLQLHPALATGIGVCCMVIGGRVIGERLSKSARQKSYANFKVMADTELPHIPLNLLQEIADWKMRNGMLGSYKNLEESKSKELEKHELVYIHTSFWQKEKFTCNPQRWISALKCVAPDILEEYINGRTAKL